MKREKLDEFLIKFYKYKHLKGKIMRIFHKELIKAILPACLPFIMNSAFIVGAAQGTLVEWREDDLQCLALTNKFTTSKS